MMNQTGVRTRVGTLPYPSASLDVPLLLRIADLGGGLMLKGDRGASVAAELRTHGYSGALMLDPARYERAMSIPAQGSLFGQYDEWIRQQEEQGVTTFIAPSHGLGPRDLDRVADVIEAGRIFAEEVAARGFHTRVVIPVNVYPSWAINRSRELLDLVADTPFTIGLLLTNSGDPLNQRGAVAGLVELIQKIPQSVMLRTDLAGGLGALSLGAGWAAIGTMPSHRHATRPGESGFSPNVTDRTPSVVVPELLTFRKASKLEQLERVDPLLSCSCQVCEGADLRRFAEAVFRHEANLHNAAVVSNLTDNLAAALDRPATWQNWCNRAIDTHARVESVTGVSLAAPLALREWATNS